MLCLHSTLDLLRARSCILFISVATLFGLSAAAQAGWSSDVGYDSLEAALGANMPTGVGVLVTQVEAAVQVGDAHTWMPNLNDAAFAGKTRHDMSGAQDGAYSGHALMVGRLLYDDATAMAYGIDEIEIYDTGNWLQRGALHANESRQPVVTDVRLCNHSWVGSVSGPDGFNTAVLRRLDWLVAEMR